MHYLTGRHRVTIRRSPEVKGNCDCSLPTWKWDLVANNGSNLLTRARSYVSFTSYAKHHWLLVIGQHVALVDTEAERGHTL